MAYTEKVRRIAANVGRVVPNNKGEMALIGYILGTAFSLSEALRLHYRDRTGARLPKGYGTELGRLARRIARGNRIDHGQWLAGFYFNASLHRMSALNDRIDKYAHTRKDLGAVVRQEVNKMKHEVEGVLNGRRVTLPMAVYVLGLLSDALLLVMSSRGATTYANLALNPAVISLRVQRTFTKSDHD